MTTISATLTTQNTFQSLYPFLEILVKSSPRRLTPTLGFKLSGLNPDELYQVMVSLERVDAFRYTYRDKTWSIQSDSPMNEVAKQISHGDTDSWHTGQKLMEAEVDFFKLKVVHMTKDRNEENVIPLQSNTKYVPTLTILPLNNRPVTFHFTIAEFIAVTNFFNREKNLVKGVTRRSPKKRKAGEEEEKEKESGKRTRGDEVEQEQVDAPNQGASFDRWDPNADYNTYINTQNQQDNYNNYINHPNHPSNDFPFSNFEQNSTNLTLDYSNNFYPHYPANQQTVPFN